MRINEENFLVSTLCLQILILRSTKAFQRKLTNILGKPISKFLTQEKISFEVLFWPSGSSWLFLQLIVSFPKIHRGRRLSDATLAKHCYVLHTCWSAMRRCLSTRKRYYVTKFPAMTFIANKLASQEQPTKTQVLLVFQHMSWLLQTAWIKYSFISELFRYLLLPFNCPWNKTVLWRHESSFWMPSDHRLWTSQLKNRVFNPVAVDCWRFLLWFKLSLDCATAEKKHVWTSAYNRFTWNNKTTLAYD